MSQFSGPTGPYVHTEQPLGPPPRRKAPWWVWVLGGCGGCAFLGIIGVAVAVALGVNSFQSEMKNSGPVDQASVQKAMGSDVPLYPKSQINPTLTQVTRASLSVASKLTGKPINEVFRGVGAFTTEDSPDKVVAFYEAKLPKLGWKLKNSRNTGMQEQYMYQKGNDGLMLQVQNQQGTTMYVLMRGNPSALRSQGGGGDNSPD